MKTLVRPIATLMLVMSMCFAVGAMGCSSASSSSAAASSASAAASATAQDGAASSGSSADEEQDDCYGDDLPATKSDKS